jgi:RNA polymerase sigma factor for flagellar operon FliA
MTLPAPGEYQEAAAASGMSAREEQQHLVAYAPLVKRIVRQLNSQVSGMMSREDMEQIGLMGLLEALRRYGAPDTAFGSFASLRIRGAILDELRRQDWRPRAVRQDSAPRARRPARAHPQPRPRADPAGSGGFLGITQEAYYQHLLDDGAEEMLSFDEVLQEATDNANSTPARKKLHGAAQPGTGAWAR